MLNSAWKVLFLGSILGVLFIIWHFFLYLKQVPDCVPSLPEGVQAIIVLTGDKQRLETGFSLLTPTRRAFVSGVHRSVCASDMPWRDKSQLYKQAVTLGYAAYNTRENALESILWIKQNRFKAVALVTSDYHMPRSLTEFRRVAFDGQIYPVPVVHKREATWYYHAFRESVGVLISALCVFLEDL
ncbi:MAG: YdcF family protein [Holosporales bacterium]|jgi:uncharacterized SAM-binding protein YcdF (DUF218 family)|nr:YdcF family protein [Holosporales bacterium]